MNWRESLSRKSFRILIRLLGATIVLTLLLVMLPKINLEEMRQSFRQASLKMLILGLVGVLGFWTARSFLLWRVLRLREKLPFKLPLAVTFIGGFFDQVIPARGGYLVRWGLLSARLKSSKSFVISALACVFVLEGLMLVLLFIGGLFGSSTMPEFGSSAMWFIAFGVILTTVIFSLLCAGTILKILKNSALKKLTPLIALFEIAKEAQNPGRLLLWVGIVFCSWVFQILTVLCVAASLQLNLNISQAILLLMSVNMAILIPVIPGNLGTIQLVVHYILVKMGISSETALAFGIIYHALHLLPVVSIGAVLSLFFTTDKSKTKQNQLHAFGT